MELNKWIKIITMVILGHSVIVISGGIIGYAYGTYLNGNYNNISLISDESVCIGCRAASLLLLIYYLYLLLKKVEEQEREIRRLWVV